MISLNVLQKEFLKKEFDIAESDLKDMTLDKWQEIRLKAFDIEAELLPADENETPSDRCKLATSIIDAEYSF